MSLVFSSGETKNVAELMEQFSLLRVTRNKQGEERKTASSICVGDILDGDARPFLDRVAAISRVPGYAVILNVLLDQLGFTALPVSRDDLREFLRDRTRADYLSIFNPDAATPETDAAAFLRTLSRHFRTLAFSRGWRLPARKTWQSEMADLFLNPSFASLRDMAFIFHMTAEEFDGLLQSVLYRSHVNYTDPAEVLTQIVLMTGRSEDSYFERCRMLESFYRKGDEKKASVKSSGSTTLSMKALVDQYLTEKGGDVYKKRDPRLAGILSSIKSKGGPGQIEHVSRHVFDALFTSLTDRISQTAYVDESWEDEKADLLTRRYIGNRLRKEASVLYHIAPGRADGLVSAEIPAGSRVGAKSRRAGGAEAVFYTEEALTLTVSERISCEVNCEVLSTEEDVDEKILRAFKESYGGVFLKKEHMKAERTAMNRPLRLLRMPELRVRRAVRGDHPVSVRLSAAVKREVVSALPGKKLRYFKKDDQGKGTLLLTLPRDHFLPEGSIFSMRLCGVNLRYRTLAPVNAVTVTLPVEDFRRERGEKETLPERLKARQPLQYAEALRSAGVLSAQTGRDGQMRPSAKNFESRVTLLCKPGTRIPSGSRFFWDSENETISCAASVSCEALSLTTTSLKLLWDADNAEQLYRKRQAVSDADKKKDLLELLPSGSSMTLFGDVLLRYEDGHTRRCPMPAGVLYGIRNDKPYKLLDETIGQRQIEKSLQQASDSGRGIRDVNTRKVLQALYGRSERKEEFDGVDSYGPDFLLNTELFRQSRITSHMVSDLTRSEETRRNIILTMTLILYVLEIEESGQRKSLLDFRRRADKQMALCRMRPLYNGAPYDQFLMLLLMCDEPLRMLRAIWSEKHPLTWYFEVNAISGEGDTLAFLADGQETASFILKAGEERYSVPRLLRGHEYVLSARGCDGREKSRLTIILNEKQESYIRYDGKDLSYV